MFTLEDVIYFLAIHPIKPYKFIEEVLVQKFYSNLITNQFKFDNT